MMNTSYIGRFAPTPSGSLHTGSILTALATYCILKQEKGKCLLRIEDLDKQRCSDENCLKIIEDLDKLGFDFDGDILIQSKDTKVYIDACEYLLDKGYAFYCKCTRSSLKTTPCTCYKHKYKKSTNTSLRFYPKDGFDNTFFDSIFKEYKATINENNFFTLIRSDDVISYNLACVVDDIRQNINHIVRGADLLDVTYFQNALYKAFNKEIPKYTHMPLVVNSNGDKLSKQNHSRPILDIFDAKQSILFCLKLLDQNISDLEHLNSAKEILKKSINIFDTTKISNKNIVVDKNLF